ncbi:hypothetical protein PsalN5692_03597 (plasmid) [Piscirickettsia salmonis]|nr:hypothetical protein [Piscirickettsia salmonis]QGP51366.1 hypothetical protein PsalN5692_02847 [Piscirickettsia salmonis]QGP52089.1 hypothetical protein PsalN5692_03597 [Piscirickettsia salmonis]
MTISQEFIDQALENCDTQEDIFGANGLVKEFIKEASCVGSFRRALLNAT